VRGYDGRSGDLTSSSGLNGASSKCFICHDAFKILEDQQTITKIPTLMTYCGPLCLTLECSVLLWSALGELVRPPCILLFRSLIKIANAQFMGDQLCSCTPSSPFSHLTYFANCPDYRRTRHRVRFMSFVVIQLKTVILFHTDEWNIHSFIQQIIEREFRFISVGSQSVIVCKKSTETRNFYMIASGVMWSSQCPKWSIFANIRPETEGTQLIRSLRNVPKYWQ